MHRFMHLGMCLMTVWEVLAHGRVYVVTRASGQVHAQGCPVCTCVCMSKRAWLRCIYMGISVCMCACTGAFTWEWGGQP